MAIHQAVRHPEAEEGEVFLKNVFEEEECIRSGLLESFQEIIWRTKRAGIVAYDEDGIKYHQEDRLHPVFVQASELIEAGYEIEYVDTEPSPSPRF